MPDGGNSGGTTWSNSQNTSQSGPSPVIAPRLESIGNDFWNWYGNNANAPAYYPGSTVAGYSPNEISARETAQGWGHSSLQNIAGVYAPAIQSLTDTASGKYLDPKLNTAFQDFLSASFRPQAEQFRDILAPAIDAKFAGSTRTAGGAHFDTTMRGVQDLERAQADAAAKAGLGLYQGERNLQQGAATAIPGVLGAKQGQTQGWLNMLLGLGQGDTAQSQRLTDADIARYNYNQTAQPDWYTRMAQMLQSIYPGGQTWGSGQSMGYSPGAGGGSLLGTGLGLAGLGLQAYSAFSDERLKDVHGRVGFTDEGLPLYLYHYKDDPTRPHIGPMAQDVAQVKPDAVAEHPSGFLMVDYVKAMPEGGLF